MAMLDTEKKLIQWIIEGEKKGRKGMLLSEIYKMGETTDAELPPAIEKIKVNLHTIDVENLTINQLFQLIEMIEGKGDTGTRILTTG